MGLTAIDTRVKTLALTGTLLDRSMAFRSVTSSAAAVAAVAAAVALGSLPDTSSRAMVESLSKVRRSLGTTGDVIVP